MKIDNSTHYSVIANSFCVSDIAQRIKLYVSPHEPLESVIELFWEVNVSEDWCCLVRDSSRIYGHLTFDDDVILNVDKGYTKEKATPIFPDMIVSSALPLIELASLFEKHYYFFVINRNDITHVVAFQDLDKLPMKLCLFSLFLELESQIIDLLLLNYSLIDQYLKYLSPNCLEKAMKLCKDKYKDMTPTRLLLCTTFVDKKEILKRDPMLQTKLPFESKHKGDLFFKLIENVRNQIAHSDSILQYLKTPSEFNQFINDLQSLTASITNSIGSGEPDK